MKTFLFYIAYAEPHPILCKYSERRVQDKRKHSCLLYAFAEVFKNKKRNESFDPFLKTIFQNDLFHFLNDSLECFVVVHCKVGESLAVDLDSSLVESTHEL